MAAHDENVVWHPHPVTVAAREQLHGHRGVVLWFTGLSGSGKSTVAGALEEALHQDELPKPRHMFLRLLAAQMGVGGDDSWMSPVHEQYQLPADQPLSLNVQLKLF